MEISYLNMKKGCIIQVLVIASRGQMKPGFLWRNCISLTNDDNILIFSMRQHCDIKKIAGGGILFLIIKEKINK